MSEERISLREYARRRGVAHTSVIKAARRGRIQLVDGKVDPVAADEAWKRNTDEAQRRPKMTATEPKTEHTQGQRVPEQGSELGQSQAAPTPEGLNYAKSRAVRETFLARLAALEYDVKKNKLVPVDEVRSRVFTLARTARDILLGIPDRVAPRIVGETNQHEIHRVIAEEVARVCNEIANAGSIM